MPVYACVNLFSYKHRNKKCFVIKRKKKHRQTNEEYHLETTNVLATSLTHRRNASTKFVVLLKTIRTDLRRLY